MSEPVGADLYGCPEVGCGIRWYRPSVGTPVPYCENPDHPLGPLVLIRKAVAKVEQDMRRRSRDDLAPHITRHEVRTFREELFCPTCAGRMKYGHTYRNAVGSYYVHYCDQRHVVVTDRAYPLTTYELMEDPA